ncbi:hypothetical protein IF1G_02737 [Cordyceps javanica]|uniref:Uncharacterized protein n=1 Tax=Cordyceps javanica TaxID=43265 RepID=A0A545VA98_9HYPO|nr:hypothetical protein IF1G_02737 [Cordyceps javanica]
MRPTSCLRCPSTDEPRLATPLQLRPLSFAVRRRRHSLPIFFGRFLPTLRLTDSLLRAHAGGAAPRPIRFWPFCIIPPARPAPAPPIAVRRRLRSRICTSLRTRRSWSHAANFSRVTHLGQCTRRLRGRCRVWRRIAAAALTSPAFFLTAATLKLPLNMRGKAIDFGQPDAISSAPKSSSR